MFDINLFTVNEVNGVERKNFPGLICMNPPRRAARGRENDALVILLTITGETNLTADVFQDWLQQKVTEYYKTSGTVTMAMKALVESINNELLERNLKHAKEGNQVSAMLNFAVLRKENLYLTNVGPTRSFFINKDESVEISETESQTRGLGVDQMLTPRLIQKPVNDNDILLFAPLAPLSWSPIKFEGSTSLTIDALSRRIFDQAGVNLKISAIRFNTGKGEISTIPLQNSPVKPMYQSIPKASVADTKQVEGIKLSRKKPSDVMNLLKSSRENPQTQVFSQKNNEIKLSPNEVTATVNNEKISSDTDVNTSSQTDLLSDSTDKPVTVVETTDMQAKAGKMTQTAVSWFSKITDSATTYIKKIFPGFADESIQLTRTTLIGIAMIVPILIVIIAGSIYTNRGEKQQFNLYLLQAQEYAIKAETLLDDEPSRIASLQQSLFWLDKAETYGQSTNSISLRNNVQNTLDMIEGVQRLEFVPVVDGGLTIGTNITEIIASNTDVYLLDSNSGTVDRYYLNGSYYEEDENFDCGPNPKNSLNTLGPIIDMVGINVNNSFKATLFVIDRLGNVEYCIPGESGVIGSLTSPDQGWVQIKSISLNSNYLYVMDPGGNAVYRYGGSDGMFNDKPTLFFDNVIPEMVSASDIEVNDDELYMLRTNGEMVECTYSHMKDYKLTECIDPAPYSDIRTTDTPELISFPEAQFIQMRMTNAPDSSIYLLDAIGKSLYHFSLQRNLQKIMHPRLSDGLKLDNLTPTAFTVSSARMVFMAFRNQIYYATLP